MLHCVDNLPTAAIILALVGGFSLAGQICLWINMRWLRPLRFHDATELGEIFSDAIGTIFALLFALITVAVWQNYDRLDKTVSNEANTLHNIYCNLAVYPPAVRDPARRILKQYVHQVAEVEWPMLKDGRQDPVAHRVITAFDTLINAYQPATIGELPRHTEMLHLVDACREMRHDRLQGATTCLDQPMWLGLFTCAGLFLGYATFFAARNSRAHRVMVGFLGAAVGMVFYMLLIYNYPFAGPAGISPQPFRDLVQRYWVID